MFFCNLYYRDDLRTANIIVDDEDGATCLVIDKESFNLLSNDKIYIMYLICLICKFI